MGFEEKPSEESVEKAPAKSDEKKREAKSHIMTAIAAEITKSVAAKHMKVSFERSEE
jgi:hypothetical protein